MPLAPGSRRLLPSWGLTGPRRGRSCCCHRCRCDSACSTACSCRRHPLQRPTKLRSPVRARRNFGHPSGRQPNIPPLLACRTSSSLRPVTGSSRASWSLRNATWARSSRISRVFGSSLTTTRFLMDRACRREAKEKSAVKARAVQGSRRWPPIPGKAGAPWWRTGAC